MAKAPRPPRLGDILEFNLLGVLRPLLVITAQSSGGNNPTLVSGTLFLDCRNDLAQVEEFLKKYRTLGDVQARMEASVLCERGTVHVKDVPEGKDVCQWSWRPGEPKKDDDK